MGSLRRRKCRPRVSNDNPYAESLFKTLKCRTNYQPNGFATLNEARKWVNSFVKWYNHDHHHSGLKFLTPYQRRSGLSDKILAKRRDVYEAAKAAHPERWISSRKREANTRCILDVVGATATTQRNPLREGGELCPKPERYADDLS